MLRPELAAAAKGQVVSSRDAQALGHIERRIASFCLSVVRVIGVREIAEVLRNGVGDLCSQSVRSPLLECKLSRNVMRVPKAGARRVTPVYCG